MRLLCAFYEGDMKKVLKVLGIILAVIVAAALALFIFLAVDEYRPEETENLEISGDGTRTVEKGSSIRLLSWNLGYGALGDDADYFMDGGTKVYTDNKKRVYENLDYDLSVIEEAGADIVCVQEIDRNSSRSWHIDEFEYFTQNTSLPALSAQSIFALNYKVAYIPLPVPPMGKIYGGISLFSDYEIEEAQRISLPCPFDWPYRILNLKRCLEVTRFPVEGSDKQLVVINLHLEAFDNGEGKAAQTLVLKEVLDAEVSKGNYVIAVGDFNQTFGGTDTANFPAVGKEGDFWMPGLIDENEFGEEFSLYQDEKVASGRSLDRALTEADSTLPSDFQYYIIDGMIVSDNIEVEDFFVEDHGFYSSDHNPMIIDFKLK